MAMPDIACYSLSESALVLSFGEAIDPVLHQSLLRWYNHLRAHPFPGLTDLIPAYCTLTILYNPVAVKPYMSGGQTTGAVIEQWLKDQLPADQVIAESTLHLIPVCYEPAFAPDMALVEAHTGLSATDIIALHTNITYTVFMMGFLPGFPYLGLLDPALHFPRLATPRSKVAAGSVGIAGRQTGIYALESPGGWGIIGRTPLSLFSPHLDNPLRLKTGDRVQFMPISTAAFQDHLNTTSL
jgi:inhibitor of KinA